MAKYNLVHVGPNNWFDYKADSIFGFMATLQQLGHDVDFSNNRFDSNRTNIVIGSDWLVRGHSKNILADKGLDYILIEGEFIYNNTLNLREDINFELFLDYLRHSKTILTPYKHNLLELRDLGIEAQYFKWGDFPGRYKGMDGTTKTYLSGYYGMLKGQRKQHFDIINAKLNNKIFCVTAEHPYKFKEFCLNFCESILSLRSGDREFVNPIRIIEAAANGVPVYHNHNYDPDGYTESCIKLPDIQSIEPEIFNLTDRQKKEISERMKSVLLIDSIKNCAL